MHIIFVTDPLFIHWKCTKSCKSSLKTLQQDCSKVVQEAVHPTACIALHISPQACTLQYLSEMFSEAQSTPFSPNQFPQVRYMLVSASTVLPSAKATTSQSQRTSPAYRTFVELRHVLPCHSVRLAFQGWVLSVISTSASDQLVL